MKAKKIEHKNKTGSDIIISGFLEYTEIGFKFISSRLKAKKVHKTVGWQRDGKHVNFKHGETQASLRVATALRNIIIQYKSKDLHCYVVMHI